MSPVTKALADSVYAADTELEQTNDKDPMRLAALNRLGELSGKIIKQDLVVSDLKTQLKAAEDEYRRLSEKAIPVEMALLGYTTFPIPNSNGASLDLKQEVHAEFPKSDKFPQRAQEARDWLVKNGNGSICKQSITIEFTVEDTKAVEKTIKELVKKNPHRIITRRISVHAGSLKKVIRQLLKEGEGATIPYALLGAHVVDVAQLKLPKEE